MNTALTNPQLEFNFSDIEELNFDDSGPIKIRYCERCGSRLSADERDVCDDCIDEQIN